jgi:hypothetical protein
MHIERDPSHVLLERLTVTQWLPLKVLINLIPGHALRPIFSLLNQRLTVNTRVMKVEDPSRHTKHTVH